MNEIMVDMGFLIAVLILGAAIERTIESVRGEMPNSRFGVSSVRHWLLKSLPRLALRIGLRSRRRSGLRMQVEKSPR